MLLWIFGIVLCVYFYVRVIKPHHVWKERNVEHKKPLPILGNMAPNIFRKRTFVEVFQDLYNEFDAKYYGVYQFLSPCIMLKDIELIKQVTIKDFEYFLNHRAFIDENLDPLFGKNLFGLQGKNFAS